jgi:hypothetical protein
MNDKTFLLKITFKGLEILVPMDKGKAAMDDIADEDDGAAGPCLLGCAVLTLPPPPVRLLLLLW